MSLDWKIWNKGQKRSPLSYHFLSLRKQHAQRWCQLWMSPNRFLQQPRIVSNSKKPLHVFYHHHSQIQITVGVNYFLTFWFDHFGSFDDVVDVCLLGKYKVWGKTSILISCWDVLQNFELHNRVFLGVGWGINEVLIISILAHRNIAQPK